MNRECIVDGCDKPTRTKKSGLCQNHYQRQRRNGDPTISGWDVDRSRFGGKQRGLPKATTEKRCAMCKTVKPREEFFILNRESGEFLSAYCRPCTKAYYAAKRMEEKAKRPPKVKVIHDCAFEGCPNEGKSRLVRGVGSLYCMAHYAQAQAGKELTPLRPRKKSYISDDLRRCTWCDVIKPTEAFYVRSNGKPSEVCKTCVGFSTRALKLLREGRHQEALECILRAPEATKEKFLRKYATRFNEGVRSQIGEEVSA